MPEPIMVTSTAALDMDPMPLAADWVLSGSPVASGKLLATSPDKLSQIMSWCCTPGEFEWHFLWGEEVAYIIAGEVFITTETQTEQRLGPGDVAVFPAGSSAVWRITRPVRKVAVLRKHMPRPVGLAVRAWNRLLSLTQRPPVGALAHSAR